MVLAKKFVVAKIFQGEIEESDLRIEVEELPQLEDEEFLIEALYWSVDPYMRTHCRNYRIGQVMIGQQVAKVIESKNVNYPVGITVVSRAGWRTHTIVTKDLLQVDTRVLPDMGGLPVSLALGVLGPPGHTAYFGFLDICRPKEGETVVVTGAAGAVGSHVGQIAKIKGCSVIGIAGSDEKCKWLKSLGFDHVINYKAENVDQALREVAPQGIDCYFDNVGGDISSSVIYQMNPFGRISVCGSISAYNDSQMPFRPITERGPISASYNKANMPKATIIQPAMIGNKLEMKGFIVAQFQDRWSEAFEQNLKWVKEGRLKYRETVTEGFENMTRALIGVMKGKNIGKAIVKAAVRKS